MGGKTQIVNSSIKGSFRYMFGKVKKIYGGYIIAELMMFIVSFNSYVIPEWETNKLNLIIRIMLHIFMLQSYIPKLGVAYSFNGPTWYLSAFLLIWLLTPLIKSKVESLKSKKSYLIVSGLIIAVQLTYLVLIYSLKLEEQKYFMYVFPGINLLIYTEAVVLATFAKKYWKEKNNSRNELMLFTVIGSVVLLYLLKNMVPVDFRVLLWELPVILLIIALMYHIPGNRNLVNRTLMFLGNISTEIFLFHYIAIHYLDVYGVMNIQYVGVISAFIVSVLIAYMITEIRKKCHEKNMHGGSKSYG